MASLIDFINSDFSVVALLGFSAGFLICSFIFAIRAAVNLAVKIFKGRG